MAFEFDLCEAERFLDLFGEGDAHAFQYFDDTKKTRDAKHFYAKLTDVASVLTSLNRSGMGIYFMVNEGDGEGRSAKNVKGIRALFADLDGAPLQPVLDCPLEPHVIVQSSPTKYHVYWLVDDCPLSRFSAIQQAIARRFNGDATVHDLSRVMRVPGFWNCKTKYFEPFRVKVIRTEQGLPYKLERIVTSLGLAKLEIEEVEKQDVPLPSLDVMAPKSIPPGQRHEMLLRFAFKFAAENRPPAEIRMLLDGINYRYCTEPKPDLEVEALVVSALQKAPHVNFDAILEKGKPKPLPLTTDEEVFAPKKDEDSSGTTFALPEELILSAPGVVGEIANWLTETNFYWQPSYSLAAALSFVGMIKGHNVCTQDNARTNLLTIAVGPSSSGKTVPLKRLMSLAREAGLSHRLSGEPMSEQGLVKGLVDCGHKTFIPWDEIGLAFKGMFSSNAPGYKAGIVRLILKMYSMADETVLGFQYANGDNKNPRMDLHQPCLCLYGTTTQQGIFGAFSSVEAVNGFAARLLIFETHNPLAERQPVGMVTPPQHLVEMVKAIANEKPQGAGNLSGVFVTPIPRVVPYSTEAKSTMKEAGRLFEERKNRAIVSKRSAEESIWGRAYEQATKLALTVEDGMEISLESAKWAVELISQLSIRMIIAAREQIADNQTHAEVNKLLRMIKDASPKWVDRNYLYQQSRSIPRQRRKEYLLSLQEEGIVIVKEETTNGRKRTLYRFVA